MPARLASAGAVKVMAKSPLEGLVVPVPVVVFCSTTSAWTARGKIPIRAKAHDKRNIGCPFGQMKYQLILLNLIIKQRSNQNGFIKIC